MSQPTSPAENPYQPPSLSGADEGGIAAEIVSPEQLKWTGYGLRTVYMGILLIILGFLTALLMTALPAIMPLGFGLMVIGSLTILAGQMMCTTVPTRSGARTAAIFSVICQLAGLLSGFAGGLLGLAIGAVGGLRLATPAAFVLFFVFMRRLAGFLQRPDLQRRTSYVMYGAAALIAGVVVFGLVSTATWLWQDPMNEVMVQVTGIGLLIGGTGLLLGGLVLFVTYANLVNALSKAITQLRRDTGGS